MTLSFSKYQGTGNDFILIDNREGAGSTLTREQIAFLCNRRFGIGADGLMLLQERDGYDFEMVYFNADGAEGSMCGNGGRCIVMFAKKLGLVKQAAHFLATDGPHDALVTEAGHVELKMKNVSHVERRNGVCILNTGSPHYVQPVTQLSQLDVFAAGRAIRYNDEFRSEGINVNFIEPLQEGIAIRTYERGVEDETLSCGTGATAAALSVATVADGPQEIALQTHGGSLSVKFVKRGPDQFEDIWLCGPAQLVFEGTISSAHVKQV
jgi:diaminopimelate epimerase